MSFKPDTAALIMASKSNMCVKLYVNDGCGIGTCIVE